MPTIVTFIKKLVAIQVEKHLKLGRILPISFMLLFGQICFPELAWSQSEAWKNIPESAINFVGQRHIVPDKYRTLQLDNDQWRASVAQVPKADASQASRLGALISLPMPDGSWEWFRVVEDQLMDNQPASIRTFAGQGVDDPTATLRMDWTMWGFHAMVLSAKHTVFIDPYAHGDSKYYLSYFKRDFSGQDKPAQLPKCEVGNFGQNRLSPTSEPAGPPASGLPVAMRANGTQRRTYRIAVSTTGEYTTFHGGTVAGAQAAIATSINRVRGVYEREVAVSFTLLNQPTLIFTDATTDPFTNNNGSMMLGQNQILIDAEVGNANYDIGHVFSTGGGGIAGLGVVCVTGQKARGVTGSTSPVNDPFDIDYVAHEIGHQFAGNHTFNGSTGNCSGANRSAANAYEPGSGTTIMAYAGICPPQDIQPNSDPFFHVRSYDEILTFTQTGAGNNCPVVTATGNTPPTVTVPAGGFSIPINTPFVLTGTGADADGDPITYSWEQFDLGPTGAPNSPADDAPIFRSFSPVSSPSRTFPKIQDIVNNTQVIGEILPSYARNLNFRLMVRDNRSGGGGANYASIGFLVTDLSGPFVVTAPNTAVSWPINSTQTVTWDVANTTAAPVNCANVRILLSTDGGFTYPTILVASTANDGSENITVPNVGITNTARVRVEAVGNIFFDISNTNFSVSAALPVPTISSFTPTSGPEGIPVTITGTNFTGATAVSFNNVNAVSFTVNNNTQITATVPPGATTGLIRVTTPVATAVSASAFTVTPTITNFAPASGNVGTVVIITGTTFTGATAVSFNGTNAPIFTVNNATQITVTAPSGVTSGPIQVNTPNGNAISASNFTVVPLPTITNFSPSAGPVGTVVIITGTNFTGASAVRFNGLNAASFAVNNAGQITATVAASTTTGLVTVTTPGGTATSASNFTVLLPPTISAVNPPNGPAGTTVTITGTNLSSATQLTFNGTPATITSNTATQIVANVPVGATTGLINVTTLGGSINSSSNFIVACIWNGAWTPRAPTAVDDAITEAGYATSTGGNIVCRNLTIGSGLILEISAGTTATINGNFTNNGNVNVRNGGAFVQTEGSSIITAGIIRAFRNNDYPTTSAPAYNFWSPPVNNADISLLAGTLPSFRFSYDEPTNQWRGVGSGINLAGTTMRPGVGYAAINAGNLTFVGPPNNGNIAVGTTRTPANASFQGFNLVGNPYPSPLLISDGAGGNTGLLEDAINNDFAGTAYVWTDDRAGAGSGFYTAINATSLADPGRTGTSSLINYVTVAQGFFALRNTTGTGNLTFRNLHRLGTVANPSLFRQEGNMDKHLVLGLSSSTGAKDLFQLTFGDNFSERFDAGADAYKLDRANGPRLAGQYLGARHQILALSSSVVGMEVPLSVMVDRSSTYVFAAEKLSSTLEPSILFLEDRQTGDFYYLEPGRQHPIQLTAGNHQNRFYLRGASEVIGQAETTRVHSFANELFVSMANQSTSGALIQVYDTSGSLVHHTTSSAITNGKIRTRVPILRSGLYLVKVTMQGEVINAKVWLEN